MTVSISYILYINYCLFTYKQHNTYGRNYFFVQFVGGKIRCWRSTQAVTGVTIRFHPGQINAQGSS